MSDVDDTDDDINIDAGSAGSAGSVYIDPLPPKRDLIDKLHPSCAPNDRWVRMGVLVRAMERLLEANSKLDVYEPDDVRAASIDNLGRTGRPPTRHNSYRRAVCKKLDAMQAKIDHEIDMVTAAKLQLDLVRRKEMDEFKYKQQQAQHARNTISSSHVRPRYLTSPPVVQRIA